MKKAVYLRYEYIFAYNDNISKSNNLKCNTIYRIYLNTVQHAACFIISTVYVVLTGAGLAQTLQ